MSGILRHVTSSHLGLAGLSHWHVHKTDQFYYTNTLLSFSILLFNSGWLQFVFLIIMWKFCESRSPPSPNASNLLEDLSSAASVHFFCLSHFFCLFLDLSRCLPLPLLSFYLAQNTWRGSQVGPVFWGQEKQLTSKKEAFRTKDSRWCLLGQSDHTTAQTVDLCLILLVHLTSTLSQG